MGKELIRAADFAPPPLLTASPGHRLSAREIIDTLFRQKGLILLLWSLVLLATLGYLFLTPSLYESEMTILVKDKRVEASLAADGAEKPKPSASDSQIATEIQLLSSRELLRTVAVKTGLANANSQADLERATARLKKQIHISPVLKSSLIQVRYADPDARRSAAVLRTLSDLYMDMHLRLHSSPGSFEFFSRQVEEYEKKLREAQEKLREFQGERKIVLLPAQKDLTLRKLLEAESALREAQSEKAEAALREAKLREQMASMGRRITTQSRRIPNQYSVERLNTMLAELQNKRTELLSKFRAGDRMVKQVEQQIADTRKALESAAGMSSSEEATDINPVRQTLEGELARTEVTRSGLTARIASLSSQVRDLRGRLAGYETASADDELLLHDVESAEQNFVLYSKKREEARIAQELDKERIANVALVDPPRVPALPQSKMSSGAPAAFVLGTLLVLSLGFAWGHRREVVHTPWELEAAAGLPVLATIPLHGKTLLASPRFEPPPRVFDSGPEQAAWEES